MKDELLEKVWVGLDECWTDLDRLRGADTGEVFAKEDLDRFVHGWQVRDRFIARGFESNESYLKIFIFECGK